MTDLPNLLFFDRRQSNPEARVHALVIGISDYLHLPARDEAAPHPETLDLTKVECGALSAWHFAN